MKPACRPVFLLLLGLALVAGCSDSPTDSGSNQPYEVWLVDQSNSAGLAHGGTIYIYDGRELEQVGGSQSAPTPARIDLGGATTTMCAAQTGANPVRPHVLVFNEAQTHAVLSFVGSGHVVILDARTRVPLSCIRATAGAGGARQAHAATPSPDGSFILIANQNGKLLERIETDFVANRFTLNPAATLDLANCNTPGGAPCQSASSRPDNAPIFPIITSSSDLAFVTLRGGGMFVVNARSTPMSIRAEYDRTLVNSHGLGGIEANGSMFINSGGGTAAQPHGFFVYRFPTTFGSTNAPNTPAPAVMVSDPLPIHDSHGMVAPAGQRFLWVADRSGNTVEIFDATTNARAGAIALAGALSSDPSPDLVDVAPGGGFAFFSLRGPLPLTGDPSAATGSTPGLSVVRVDQQGRSGTMLGVVRISNQDVAGAERADAHAIRVRSK